MFEKAYCEYRLNRVESSLKTIESAPEQTDKLKELYGQVVRLVDNHDIFNAARCSGDCTVLQFRLKFDAVTDYKQC